MERLIAGDWRSAVVIAAPTVLVAYVLGLLASSYVVWIGTGQDKEFLGHSSGGFFRSAFAFTGMAFGSPAFISGGKGHDHVAYQAGMAPLTITLLTAAAFVFLLRRYDDVGTLSERIDLAVRSAAVTAVGLALLTFGMHATLTADGDTVHQSGSPGRTLGWSLLLFVVTAVLTSVRRWDLSERVEHLWDQWRLPVLGAIVALVVAVVIGGVTGILIIVAQADGSELDVLKALPVLLAYFVNLGVDVFQIAIGGALRASAAGGSASVSLFDRHGLSAAYLLLLLLPPLAIGAGVSWIRRHRSNVEPRSLARACYRMALPAALIYLVLATASRAGFSLTAVSVIGSGGHVGAQVLLGTLIAFGWFLVVGYLAGQWWLPRDTSGAGGPAPRPPRLPAWLRGSVAAGPFAIVVGVVGVLVSAAGVATADSGTHPGDFGPAGGVLSFGSFVGASQTGSTSEGASVVPPATPTVGGVDPTVRAALETYATAEEVYFMQQNTYTLDPSQLSSLSGGTSSLTVTIARADTTSFCVQTFAPDGSAWSYDSLDATVNPSLCTP